MMVNIILAHCKIVAKIRCKMDRPGFLLLMRQHFSQSAESPTPFSFSEKENSLTDIEKKKEKYNFDELSAPAGRRAVMTPTWPKRDAWWRGVSPCKF